MKRYKAVVIDGKKLIRRAVVFITVVTMSMLCLLNFKISDLKIGMTKGEFAKKLIDETLPQIAAASEEKQLGAENFARALRKSLTFVLTFDPYDPRTLMNSQLPVMQTVSRGYLASKANGEVAAFNPVDADKGMGQAEPATPGGTHPICEVDSSQAKTLGKTDNKILIRNETDYGINVDEMLASALKINMQGSGPKVLILHTHTTESYTPEGVTTYSADKSDRSLDSKQNMIAVGEAVKSVFDKAGIEAIHDKTVHDHPSFNGSYANSLKTVERYKAQYPSICMVLDLHRDAYVYENGSKAKFVTDIDGQKTAQLMLVVGTNGGGLDHSDWRENMKLALKLQNTILQKYPTLMRGVNLRKERFNGHTTHGSMIIEVGSSGNTLAEAKRGATLGAEEIARFLNTLK